MSGNSYGGYNLWTDDLYRKRKAIEAEKAATPNNMGGGVVKDDEADKVDRALAVRRWGAIMSPALLGGATGQISPQTMAGVLVGGLLGNALASGRWNEYFSDLFNGKKKANTSETEEQAGVNTDAAYRRFLDNENKKFTDKLYEKAAIANNASPFDYSEALINNSVNAGDLKTAMEQQQWLDDYQRRNYPWQQFLTGGGK